MIASKINTLSPGQIMTYFEFYPIKKEKEFYLYKNNQNYFVFIYRDESQELCFLETVEFLNHNQVSFFIFMIDNLDKSYLNTATLDSIKIEEEAPIELTVSTSREDILRGFFNLSKSELYKDTSFENILFERNGGNCVVFYQNDKPVDIVSFRENDEQVFSEFGNNFGCSLQDNNSDTLIATYNPSLLLDKNLSNFNIAITKFYVPDFDFVSIINKTASKNIIIPTKLKFSKIYKLRILLNFYSLCNKSIHFSFNHSPNFFYIELSFHFKNEENVKLEMLNLVDSFKTDFHEFIKKHEDIITKTIEDKYFFDLKMEELNGNFLGKIIFRNNSNMLDIVNSRLEEYINTNSDYKFSS